jgi:DNA mismatch endonuclease (patch repair protein)
MAASDPRAPAASSAAVRATMQGNRGRDTAPETALRAALHARGLRFFKHRRPIRGLACEADVVFTTAKVAVFVDGCFWHGCPVHGRQPRTNGAYWSAKIKRNAERDSRNNHALTSAGWLVVRTWEHDEPGAVADTIARLVDARRRGLGVSPGDLPPGGCESGAGGPTSHQQGVTPLTNDRAPGRRPRSEEVAYRRGTVPSANPRLGKVGRALPRRSQT